MANRSTPWSPTHNGWFRNEVGNTLDLYKEGTKVASYSSAVNATTGAVTATTLVTGTTGLVATTGDIKGTAGNLRLGAISTFGTTEPTSAVVMKVGTNPVGAITTSGGIFVTTGGATISKIIAAGTVSTVQT